MALTATDRSTTAVVEVSPGLDAMLEHATAWDELAEAAGSAFASTAWLTAWARERAEWPLACATVTGEDGTLQAGALVQRKGGRLRSAGDELTARWDLVARSESAAAEVWSALAREARSLAFDAVPAASAEAGSAALRAAGYGVSFGVLDQRSPYVELPDSFDELLASCSKNHRKDWRKRLRRVGQAGELTLRFGSDRLEEDLELLFVLEASGWKGRQGTALRSDPSAERLFRSFAGAARPGSVRVAVLELDGQPIAASLITVAGGVAAGVKAGFDERHRELAPGVLHHGEVLRACIEDPAIHTYDFLGAADQDKLRWTRDVRPVRRMVARRGLAGRARAAAWRGAMAPALSRAREEVASRPRLRARAVQTTRAVTAITRRGGRS